MKSNFCICTILVAIFFRIFSISHALGQSQIIDTPWTVPITISLDGGDHDNVTFGTKIGATDTFDVGMDVLNPPSPPDRFDAFFQITHPTFPNLSEDFRSNEDSPNTWTLMITGTSGSTGTISWDASAVPVGDGVPGKLEIRSGETILADMLSENSLNFSGAQNLQIFFEAPSPVSLLQTKIFLEGPYNSSTDEMSTTLNPGGPIPLTSPYSEDDRTVASIPADITDWVLVQLRSTADGAAVASKSAFLHKDGRIVADDGTTGQITMNVADGDYYIIIKHRNHLAVMSASAVALSSSSSTLYDFTIGSGQFYGSGGAKELESNVWGMWSGDINQDGQTTTSDFTQWFNSARAGDSGYQTTDTNLDGQVTTSDFTKWFNNARAGASSTVP